MPFVQAGGVRLHYIQEGDGPDVVLLHGVTANLAVWMFNHTVATLSKTYRVTAYDLRGHGASEVTASGYTSDSMARDLYALAEVLKLGRAVLVGHSFGAVVATHAAVLQPERVSGLIVSDPYYPGLFAVEPNYRKSRLWSKVVGALAPFGIDLREEIDFAALFNAVAQLTPDQVDGIRKAMGVGYARWLEQLIQLAHTTCGTDAFQEAGLTRERIENLRVPVVALYDEHTEFAATRAFLEANLKDCVTEVVPGARHLAPIEAGPVFNELLMKYLERLHAPAREVA